MANWNNPTTASTATNFPDEIKDRDIDTATWFEGSSSTNIPVNTKRYNATSDLIEYWDGSAWNELPLGFAKKTGDTFTGQVTVSYTGATLLLDGQTGNPTYKLKKNGNIIGYFYGYQDVMQIGVYNSGGTIQTRFDVRTIDLRVSFDNGTTWENIPSEHPTNGIIYNVKATLKSSTPYIDIETTGTNNPQVRMKDSSGYLGKVVASPTSVEMQKDNGTGTFPARFAINNSEMKFTTDAGVTWNTIYHTGNPPTTNQIVATSEGIQTITTTGSWVTVPLTASYDPNGVIDTVNNRINTPAGVSAIKINTTGWLSNYLSANTTPDTTGNIAIYKNGTQVSIKYAYLNWHGVAYDEITQDITDIYGPMSTTSGDYFEIKVYITNNNVDVIAKMNVITVSVEFY